jgi:hypothetical protein
MPVTRYCAPSRKPTVNCHLLRMPYKIYLYASSQCADVFDIETNFTREAYDLLACIVMWPSIKLRKELSSSSDCKIGRKVHVSPQSLDWLSRQHSGAECWRISTVIFQKAIVAILSGVNSWSLKKRLVRVRLQLPFKGLACLGPVHSVKCPSATEEHRSSGEAWSIN